ncbi:MAG: PTS sugar transporter subunit IIB [Bulleidia sp.]
MIRIAIVCGGGFSSSALASHLEKDVQAKHLENEVHFDFIPASHIIDRQDEVDIALLCPHLEIFSKQQADRFHIPISIIPPRLYGLMPVDAFIEDAQDLLALYKENPHNPIHFEDEPKPLRITRTTSHRQYLAKKNNG